MRRQQITFPVEKGVRAAVYECTEVWSEKAACYMCPHCAAQVSDTSGLSEVVMWGMLVSNAYELFRCDVCGKAFAVRSSGQGLLDV